MNNRIALGSNLGKSIGNGTTNRYFTTLDGTADYYTIPTVSLTADFEIEFDTTTVQTTTEVFLGSGTSTDDFIASISGTSIKVKIGGVDVSTIAATFNDGKLHNIKVKRVGTTVTTYLDDVSIGSGTSANTFVIAKLGAYNAIAELFHTGVISEVKITDGTDLIRYYKIDEDLSATSTIIDSGSDGSNGTAVSITSSELFTLEGADWIGAELVTNGSFATDLSSWVITGEDGTHSITWDNGSALFLSDTTTPALKMEQILSSIIVGCAYKLTHNISVNSGTNTIKYSSAFNNLVLIDGIAEQIEIAANTFYSITRNSVNVDLNINQLSVKRILQAP